MISRFLVLLLAFALPANAGESPILTSMVSSGALPPQAERLPEEPLIVNLAAKGREPGQPGGTLRMFITKPKDIRRMVVYGYARLVSYTADYALEPDLLRDVEVDEGRIFTFHLRKGHRWSDGHPFTTEDFRYWWEDVANNAKLSPGGAPELMLVEGEPAEVTVIDETTIRFAWNKPNPRFLTALAQARPPFIYRPAHYMKNFHAGYTDEMSLKPLMERKKVRNWAQLHNTYDNMYKNDNPDLPTLQPWINRSGKNSQGYALERNPFYHRVDTNGVQLPYIDQVELTIASGGLIPTKVTLGEADLQILALSFKDAPVLKDGEEQGGYRLYLWSSGAGAEIALYPNQNYKDPAFRALFRDAEFRRALSLAVSRKTINRTLYFGLAKETNVAAQERSPFFDAEWATRWTQNDLHLANAKLDEIGLEKRDSDGIRLLEDGRRLELVVESAGERPEEGDALELVAEMWRDIGVRMIYRPLDRDILRNKAYSGEAMMPVWFGWDNGIPTANAPPVALAPVDQANFSWPMWGQFFQTKGNSGEAPQTEAAQELLALFHAWREATDDETRAQAWREMLAIHADQVMSIGLVSAAPQPVVASKRLRNVPEKGIYAWEPGAQLGVHRMDEFWFAD